MFKALFIITLIGFIPGQFARLQLPNGVAITLLDMLVAFFVGYGIFHTIQKKKIKRELLIPVVIFFAVGVFTLFLQVAVLQSQQLFVAFLYGLRWILYAAVFFVVSNTDRHLKKEMQSYLLIAGGAVVLLGFVQYFLYNNLRNLYYLQWDDHLYRMFSVFLDPNFAGVFFCLYLFFVIPYMLRAYEAHDRKQTVLYGIVCFLTLLAVILTYSRTALLVLAAGVVALIIIRLSRRAVLGFLAVILGLVVVFSDIGVEGRNPFRSVSSIERLRSMKTALEIIGRHPILGVGFNAYRYAQNRYGYRTSDRWQVSHADAGTDNSYLFVLATTGVVGFAVYVHLWYRIIIQAKRNKSSRLLLYPTIAGLLVSALFLNTLFYPMLLYWFWAVLGVTEST